MSPPYARSVPGPLRISACIRQMNTGRIAKPLDANYRQARGRSHRAHFIVTCRVVQQALEPAHIPKWVNGTR